MKIVSIVLHTTSMKSGQLYEYPELQPYLRDGYHVFDTIPPWGCGNKYVITFLLDKEEEEPEPVRAPVKPKFHKRNK